MAKDSGRNEKERELGYEEVIARLEEVVRRLEAGNLPLEESLKAFEEGISLVRQGEARLGEAERRIEQLLATPRGDEVAPFEAEGADLSRRPQQPGRVARPSTGDPEEPPPPGDRDAPFSRGSPRAGG